MRRCIYCHQDEGRASPKCNMRQPEGGAHFFETIAARVEPVTRDRFVLSLSPGYRAVWFKLANGGVEIVILDTQATETTRLAVAPPKPDQTLRVHMPDPDQIEILYEGKK